MALIRALLVVIALLVLAVPVELPGCGGGPPSALFLLTRQPEDPERFAQGQLGVLQQTYDRKYLVIAYRHMIGAGMNQKERAAIFSLPERAGDPSAWSAARKQVSLPPGKPIVTSRPITGNGYLSFPSNCGTDAFRTAAATLADRSQKFGPASSLFYDWVRAQDFVFTNCGGTGLIPEPTEEPRLRADREYQIAAAQFYASHFDEARADFERIAQDPESPWRASANYLAARCLIRGEKLAEAEARLDRVIADPALSAWHDRARRLRNYVVMKTRPAERLHEVAQALVRPNSEDTIGQDMIDYCWPRIDEAQRPHDDDLSDWIAAFRSGDRDRALEKWRATHSVPWLAAALHSARPAGPDAQTLLAAAREIGLNTPAYAMISYDSLKLLTDDQARFKAGRLLQMQLPASARNLFLAERMRLARDWNEFLRYSPRQVVGEVGMDGDVPVADTARYFGSDAAEVLNQAVPLELLKQAADGKVLPASLRRELALSVFARSVLLADSPDFDSVLTLLRSPGISPWVRAGYGRRIWNPSGMSSNVPTRLESFRDNWWPAIGTAAIASIHAPAFLSEDDRKKAAAEWNKLRALPPGANWLGAQTLAFAAAHPDDPRVPEALHLVVKASRYGATDQDTGGFSKRAFDLLHRKYPNTEWARKTPYWFK